MNILFVIALILFVVTFVARTITVIINPARNKLTKFLSSVTILIPLATIVLSKDLIFFFSDVAIGFEIFVIAVIACLFLLFLCSCYQIYREYDLYNSFIEKEQERKYLENSLINRMIDDDINTSIYNDLF